MSYFKLATLMHVLTGYKSGMKFPESSQGLAWHTLISFFHVRMAVRAYGQWGSFSSASTSARALVEPLRVGAGLEDLQDQAVKMHPPPRLLAVDIELFLS